MIASRPTAAASGGMAVLFPEPSGSSIFVFAGRYHLGIAGHL
jgi:hypothetical protein